MLLTGGGAISFQGKSDYNAEDILKLQFLPESSKFGQ